MSEKHLPSAHESGVHGLTIGGLFLFQAKYRGGQPALETSAGSLSYRQLNARANRVANALLQLGIRPGDCIAVLSENRHEYIEVQLASAKLGVPVACQNWRQAETELAYCLKLVEPRLLFVSERMAGRLSSLSIDGCRTIVFGADYEDRLLHSREEEPPHAALPEDSWVVLYTSGSTGYPKAAAISHRALIARGAIAVTDGIVRPGKTYVAWAPLFHIASTDSVMITLLHGGKAILLDGFDADAIVRTVTTQEIGTLSLMPATVAPLVQALERSRLPVRSVGSTGAMADLVPPQLIAAVTSLLGAPFRNSFGSTETGYAPAGKGLIPVGTMPRSLAKTQSSYCEVRLVDVEGHDVTDGEPGEVLVRGPSLFSGYWNASEEENLALFRSGWFAMGDVMRRNPDGTLDFIDRRKYLIKSGGENIYPAEIERLLLESPRVADAVVVRQPHEHWGEVPVAFVVPADPSLDEAAVVQLCRGRIANYKLPKRVVLISADEIPRTPLGKVQRQVLEERLGSRYSRPAADGRSGDSCAIHEVPR